MTLGVHVDEERLVPEACEAGGQVDAGRRLPAAALLVDDRDGPHGVPSLVRPPGRVIQPRSPRNADPSARGTDTRCKYSRYSPSQKSFRRTAAGGFSFMGQG